MCLIMCFNRKVHHNSAFIIYRSDNLRFSLVAIHSPLRIWSVIWQPKGMSLNNQGTWYFRILDLQT